MAGVFAGCFSVEHMCDHGRRSKMDESGSDDVSDLYEKKVDRKT